MKGKCFWVMLGLVILVSFGWPTTAGADTVVGGSRGGLYALPSPDVQMSAETIKVQMVGDRAYVSSHFKLINHGPDQTLKVGFPELKSANGTDNQIHNFAAYQNGTPLVVKKRRASADRAPSPAGDTYAYWYTYNLPLQAGQNYEIAHSYWVSASLDRIGGRLFRYILRTDSLWQGRVESLSVTISVSDFKPYYNLLLLPSYSYQPDKITPEGDITYTLSDLEPDKDIYLYYQPRGPELALTNLASTTAGKPVSDLISQGNFLAATGQLSSIAPTLIAQGVLSADDYHLLQAYLYCKVKDYEKAGRELDQAKKHDPAWIYYHIITSLALHRTTEAGQTFKEIDQLKQPDLTATSAQLLKQWSQGQITKYLSRPAAPVPANTPNPRQHSWVLLVTMFLLVAVSALITIITRVRKR